MSRNATGMVASTTREAGVAMRATATTESAVTAAREARREFMMVLIFEGWTNVDGTSTHDGGGKLQRREIFFGCCWNGRKGGHRRDVSERWLNGGRAAMSGGPWVEERKNFRRGLALLASRPRVGVFIAMMSDWPGLLPFAAKHRDEPLALATLVARSGSSYRPVGARLLIARDGGYVGSLSGGCLEDEVAAAAGRVLATGAPSIHEIDTRPHFGCPGRLTIFIEALAPGWLVELAERLARRVPLVVRTRYAGEVGRGSRLDPVELGGVREEAGVLVEVVGPSPRVVVVSGTSDADQVVRLAEALGWGAHRVLPAGDPGRADDAGRGVVCAPEEVVARFAPDAGTAVVVMTHHLARDLAYLRAVLPAPYPYVGLLGSRRRRETLLAELGEAGVLADDAVEARLHAPVGLDLGATDPASVALAIIAEIQAAWTGRVGGKLRHTR